MRLRYTKSPLTYRRHGEKGTIMTDEMKTTTVRLPVNTWRALKYYCLDNGLTLNLVFDQVTRELLNKKGYIDKNGEVTR